AIRAGNAPPLFLPQLPYVPGLGGAGVVDQITEGVDPIWSGRRVLVDAAASYAEFMVTAIEKVIPIPDELDTDQAMALLHDGGTALGLWETAPPSPNAPILVLPAAGGAGSVLIQLARNCDAMVLAGAGRQQSRRLAEEFGADVVLDYRQPDWASTLTPDQRPTVTFDGVGGEVGFAALEATRDGGTFISYGTAGGTLTDTVGHHERVTVIDQSILTTLHERRRERQQGILELGATGQVRAHVGGVWPLARAADAHRAFADRTFVGKALLRM
ncbi:MAG: zinc-binding dehydrogenase, partial [Propionibacteriales bacterium]|nr:zinc-binding dehydrogenase [Propionibacteriales bacterium]